jgi:dUTP pyrophosphatase
MIQEENTVTAQATSSLNVKIAKLVENAVIPVKANPTDAGLDLIATSKTITDLAKSGFIEYGTGLAIAIPDGYVGLLYPRSSISKTGLILANSVGVIDSGYRGEIKLRFKWVKDSTDYNVGDKIAQLIIMPYPNVQLHEVAELPYGDRGDKGFGSSGN